MKYSKVSSLRYSNPEKTAIDMVVFFDALGEEVPFTATPNDELAHGRELFKRAQAGKFGVVDDYEPPAPIVPSKVTAAQIGIALIQAELMGVVQEAVDSPDTPAEIKWAWAKTQDWERSSPTLAYLADRSGITSAQLDELFTVAAQIRA